MIENKDGYVSYAITDNGIATITFQHPMSNSLPGAILRKLAQTVTDLGNDDAVKVIILTSAGEKAFCAGASFDELISITNKEDGHTFFSGFAMVINAMRKCPKFVIARIQGKAVGGGVGLASAADYAIALRGSAVKLSELAVGIGPFVVGPAVERKIGLAAFSELSIDAANWRTCAWAQEKGLYASVHDTIAEVDEAVLSLATTLSKSSPEAMKDLKEVLWQGTEHWDELLASRAGISGRLVLSDFAVNAISTFKAKA
ncbi:enoyl-CoA hydratase/isomerase family protein [Taibaiella sp. KBW10]|uniref:enoyl-CoA hydratase/isomerase family protein n=1 Tax=Taibaiella sp. KBW10 TaxID=2153357 RepID=UPI0018F2C5BE|nr:enoyl-CoA hydratase/isomerase family protein [Taibaiella sp. KBW10]